MTHIGSVDIYRTMPRLATTLQVSDTPKIVSHVLAMVVLAYQCVHNRPETFRWDHDRLNKAPHDPTNDDRSEFIVATEAALSEK